MYKKDLIIDQRTDHCEEICVKALISKNNVLNLQKRRFTGTVWKLNAPGDGLLQIVGSLF